MRKTKIIATIGPSTDNEEVMKSLMLAGMNVARFNFSHGSYEEHRKRFELVDRVRKELDLPVATMLDTKGPEIRLGDFEHPVDIVDGDMFTLTTKDIIGDNTKASISFKGLPYDLKIGDMVYINDGLVELLVEKIVDNTDIVCKVIHGGKLSNHKGINVPNVSLSMPYVSEADLSDLEFGKEMDYDFIACSFVRSGADIDYLRKCIKSIGWTTPRIIAKIENLEGVNNIDEILKSADGIMVARGDMGIEIPFEKIPAIQKVLIKKCYMAGKIVVTATQMLESMITNPRPTRAEITDVANAIYDGTSAIMLSGETAAGKFPVDAVKTMSTIAETTEQNIDYRGRLHRSEENYDKNMNITNAISHATVTTAYDVNAKAIVTVTKSGTTARNISKFRPACPIISGTTDERVLRQLSLSWGVTPMRIEEKNNSDELFEHAIQKSIENDYVDTGDTVVITAGIPLGKSGTTNMLKVAKVEE